MTTTKIICINMELEAIPRIGELIRIMDLESEGTDVTDYRVVDIEWMVAQKAKDLHFVAECRVKVQRGKGINIVRDVLEKKEKESDAGEGE